MSKEVLIELFGYLGSFLVLISFLMTSVVKLRVINTIGSLIFMTYAVIIKSYPTAVMNFCLVLINLHYLWKMSKMGKEYELVKVNADDRYMDYFLESHYNDIKLCFPGISFDFEDANRFYMIVCSGTPVGLTIGQENNGVMDILLDYSIPEYRDFTIGKFLVTRLPSEGISKLVYRGPDENHQKYLDNIGYTKTEDGYEKKL